MQSLAVTINPKSEVYTFIRNHSESDEINLEAAFSMFGLDITDLKHLYHYHHLAQDAKNGKFTVTDGLGRNIK